MICFELLCSVASQTANTTIFNYTIDGMPFWMRYSHYSVISIAVCLQLRTVRRFPWLDLRSAAMRSFQYYWEEREVRKCGISNVSSITSVLRPTVAKQ